MDKTIFQFKTVQSNVFKTLGEALKEILTDANIMFTTTGLKLCAMDASQTVLVHLKLDSESFEEYFYLLQFASTYMIVLPKVFNRYRIRPTRFRP